MIVIIKICVSVHNGVGLRVSSEFGPVPHEKVIRSFCYKELGYYGNMSRWMPHAVGRFWSRLCPEFGQTRCAPRTNRAGTTRPRVVPNRCARLSPSFLKSDGRLIRLVSGGEQARTAEDVKRVLHQRRLAGETYVHGGGGNRTQSTPRKTGRYAAFSPYRHSTRDMSGH